MNKNNKGNVDSFMIMFAGVGLAITIFFGFVLVSAIGFPGGINDSYSNGARTGTITKFSHKGMFIKSYEGELNMGGMKQSTDGQGHTTTVANIFEYSVTDAKVAQDIQSALDSGSMVKLTYHQYFIAPFGLGTSYVIDKVDVIK